MEKFEEIQSMWKQQSSASPKLNSSDIVTEYNQKLQNIKRSQFWNIGILGALIVPLTWLLYLIFGSNNFSQILGLELMLFVIIIRVVAEIVSIVKSRQINFTNTFNSYVLELNSYYRFKKIVHMVLTPIIYILYTVGFISMLPLFKENLSKGFYLYVQFSGIAFLVFFSFLLFKVIKRDMNDLEYIRNINESMNESMNDNQI